ncbi:alpha-2-macroglobulin family protein [Mucilaginibacter pedocola]|uniref:Alpha-2-macroglobulin domain-containing protein n=1 Tax=Mucilaginibacter pedocola TaxID=1792845 RepID=A0A1S9P797_9SPHI|nr:alpha-2-macroglobulin family protein [Mucilaginibacter pedocola]OOQ56832.1 hypothetical protein BC343_17785 [Mucilaginibacter pedocola]
MQPKFTYAIIVSFLLICSAAIAQRPLTNSRQSSYYTYIYKVSDADMLGYYQSPGKVFDDKVLKNPVDSFLTDKHWKNTLPAGNYVKAYANENSLKYSLIENHSAFLKLFTSTYEHRFALTDKQGNYLSNIKVLLNGKELPYDAASNTWYFKHPKSTITLQAEHKGVTNFFSVRPDANYYNGSFIHRLKTAWYRFKNIFRHHNNRYKPSPYGGFMVFNKPVYKPRDTVKFKAFIFYQKNKKPAAQKQLLVKLAGNGGTKKLGMVTAYRPGAFEYSFILTDSLDLSLDNNYTVLLVDPAKQPQKKAGDDDDDDDEENNAAEMQENKSVLYTGRFKYEEYELKSINFTIRTDKKEHSPGNPLSVYLKAVDENGLPVADGRVLLNLRTRNVSNYKINHQFVPDTLWTHKIDLEPVGETKILIPDSIFPKADVRYEIGAQFLNADNEPQYKEASAEFNCERFTLSTEEVNDSLKINHLEFGKPYKTKGIVSSINADGDTLTKQSITLPGFVLINPNAAEYNIETDSTDTDVDLKRSEGNISASSERTKDSVYLSVANPRKLHFFYSVFAGNKLIDGGQATELFYKKALPSSVPVIFSINYIWAGVVRTENVCPAYRPDLLNIAVNQPVTVYPGQKVKTDIVVTDATGKPVVNTDVTAWALTKKFEYREPYVPYVGKPTFYPEPKKPIRKKDTGFEGNIKLNWQRWALEAGLDSIAYYQFTHPKGNVYRIEEPGIDTITQVAPFVVKDGNILPVHVLYIDHVPVYFSQAQQLQPYSFKVSPGYHFISIRTAKLDLSMDSVWVPRSKKLILSINGNTWPSQPVADSLPVAEANNINKYMIGVVNNFGIKQTRISQADRLYVLNPSGVAGNIVLAGPLAPAFTLFERKDEKPTLFTAEANYTYLFEPGLITQKDIKTPYPFSRNLSHITGATNYRQYVISNNAADSLWQNLLDQRANTSQLFNNPSPATRQTGELEFKRMVKENENPILIKNIIFYRYDDPDYLQVFPGNRQRFGQLDQGKYRVFFLLKGDTYTIKENIEIKPHGTNHYDIAISPEHARDSVSIKISNTINGRSGTIYQFNDNEIQNDALRLKEAFNDKYLAANGFTALVSGKIVDNGDKQPLVGVLIKIKGTNIATMTDLNGTFRLYGPPRGKLVIAYIGYHTQEITYNAGTGLYVKMIAAANHLTEVVVVGYGTTRRMSMTGSVSSISLNNALAGKVAGLQVRSPDYALGRNTQVMLRGASGFAGGQAALYVVNGEIVKDLKGIDPAMISDVTILKDAAATALYGSRAANGVIIVSTKTKTATEERSTESPLGEGAQTLRKNFSDYAHWQPKLITDDNGKASFTSTFPDDITNWRTYVVAINGHRQSGFSEKQVKSFKPLSANFIAPQFAVEGDEMQLIGKVMNYASTPALVSRAFKYNGKVITQGDLQVVNAKIDTLAITASATDSLEFEYSIKRDNGYFDGEQRKIPVIKQGTQETKGIFEAMDRDTTVNLKFDPTMGPVTFRAEASALPALAEEAKRLREYKYLCNEQLASKLKGLLSEKRIKTFLGEPFKYERNITEVIKKLQQNRKTNGTWGWWANTDDELWISLHAVEALTEAQKMGYAVDLNKKKLTDYLVYQLESYRGEDKLTCLQLLHQMGAKVDYNKYLGVIDADYKKQKDVSTYARLKLMRLKQQTGLSIKTDSLIRTAHKTMFGNMYWGEESYRFFDNAIQLSAIAYNIIKAESKHPEVLAKIRGYFLEQRKQGEWRNTYESALILETLLPDLLLKDAQIKPAVLTLKGSITETITAFPYTTTLKDNTVSVSKTGSLPVYITGYQQFWNNKPEKVSKDFKVDTWFERKGDKVTKLKGGEAVELKAEVTAKGDADFVMVEIPIPAGCSYESKDQQWSNNEVHREFFKEKVSIFCRKLKQGTYTFTVKLMPRYSGNYTLNPAKAEQMYFPVFYGREVMKKVVVQ